MKQLIGMAMALLASVQVAQASELEDSIIKFIDAAGFERHTPNGLETTLSALWLNTDRITPAADVGPLEKAVLITTEASPATRTRTALAFGQMFDHEGTPFNFVEVRHYNLGPLIREDAIAAYGAKNVDGPEAFGVGEHRAWRFVFAPIMNSTAVLFDASSREISEEEAAASDCTGRPCLDLAVSFDDLADWREMDATLPDWPRLYTDLVDRVATPAHSIAELAALGYWANAESGRYQWTGGEHPEAARGMTAFRYIGIDHNLGQEISIDTVWNETLLNDTSVAELWLRRTQIGDWTTFMQTSTPR